MFGVTFPAQNVQSYPIMHCDIDIQYFLRSGRKEDCDIDKVFEISQSQEGRKEDRKTTEISQFKVFN